MSAQAGRFDAVSEPELLEALHRVLASTFMGSDLVLNQTVHHRLVMELAPRGGIAPDQVTAISTRLWNLYFKMSPSEAALSEGTHTGENTDVRRFESVLWQLVSRGVIYPRFASIEHDPQEAPVIKWLILTPHGRDVLGIGTASPHHPAYLEKLQSSLALLQDDDRDAIVARVEDATACYGHGLLRPAVSMIGVAFEHATELAYQALEAALLVAGQAMRWSARLGQISTVVEAMGATHGDRKRNARIALGVANAIRKERNDASHPGKTVEDPSTVHGLLAGAPAQLGAVIDLLAYADHVQQGGDR